MNNCALPQSPRLEPIRPGRRAGAKGRAKFFSAKIPRNPLKRLISDERIQGNPSFSNPQERGLSPRDRRRPRKSKPGAPFYIVRPFDLLASLYPTSNTERATRSGWRAPEAMNKGRVSHWWAGAPVSKRGVERK